MFRLIIGLALWIIFILFLIWLTIRFSPFIDKYTFYVHDIYLHNIYID